MSDRVTPLGREHPTRQEPDPNCENCDSRGCMGCVLREWDHDCRNDCPSCCAAPTRQGQG